MPLFKLPQKFFNAYQVVVGLIDGITDIRNDLNHDRPAVVVGLIDGITDIVINDNQTYCYVVVGLIDGITDIEGYIRVDTFELWFD